ncbi:MAG: glutathione S-transferase [Methylovulum sp.]|nr:glutathione S-transferase [Methylovulum sp.]
MNTTLPVLYSFRRCPYAMRARLAIVYAGIPVEIREVALKSKPGQLLAISPKATVPVLQLPNSAVLDESLDIMQWALMQHDPGNWLAIADVDRRLIAWNDGDFKYYLDRYKYADRYPEFPAQYYRQQGEVFLREIENRLAHHNYLCGNDFSIADAAIFPFVRQFAAVDGAWFSVCNYEALKHWLDKLLASELFNAIMMKYPVWEAGSEPIRIKLRRNPIVF